MAERDEAKGEEREEGVETPEPVAPHKPVLDPKADEEAGLAPEAVAVPGPLDMHRPRPCVFLDRDGVIIRDVGYCNHPDRVELLPGSAAAIRKLNTAGVLAIVTSNQSGIARGFFTEEILEEINARMRELLAMRDARIDALYYAPQHPNAKLPEYRDDPDGMVKPKTGMIRKAREEWPIDMRLSYMVGDKPADVEFGRNAGLTTLLTKSGFGLGEVTYRRHLWKVEPDAIVEDLREAVKWIIKDLRRKGWRP